jgi:hypothetical protein
VQDHRAIKWNMQAIVQMFMNSDANLSQIPIVDAILPGDELNVNAQKCQFR